MYQLQYAKGPQAQLLHDQSQQDVIKSRFDSIVGPNGTKGTEQKHAPPAATYQYIDVSFVPNIAKSIDDDVMGERGRKAARIRPLMLYSFLMMMWRQEHFQSVIKGSEHTLTARSTNVR